MKVKVKEGHPACLNVADVCASPMHGASHAFLACVVAFSSLLLCSACEQRGKTRVEQETLAVLYIDLLDARNLSAPEGADSVSPADSVLSARGFTREQFLSAVNRLTAGAGDCKDFYELVMRKLNERRAEDEKRKDSSQVTPAALIGPSSR